jgi:hypothetical protein
VVVTVAGHDCDGVRGRVLCMKKTMEKERSRMGMGDEKKERGDGR